MIHEVDESLLAFLEDAPFEYKRPNFSFDPPTPEWRAKLGSAPVINLFLHHVAEMIDSRVGATREVRGPDGRVIERQGPLRRYEVGYLVTAWAATVAEEHRLLGDVLRAFAQRDALPPQHRKGSLASAELPIPLFVGMPTLDTPTNQWDIWGALGGGPKTSFDVVVSVPLVPIADRDIGPPTETRHFQFSLAGTEPEPVDASHRDELAGEANTARHTADSAAAGSETPPAAGSGPRSGRGRLGSVQEGPRPAKS